MNIVLYAGDRKYHSVLEPIAKELKNTNNSFLYYYTFNTQIPHSFSKRKLPI